MMPLKNLLYLLQLEEYDLKRFDAWLKKYSDRVVLEKKNYLQWTPKARAVFFVSNFFNVFTFGKRPELALKAAIKILSPFDWLFKNIVILKSGAKLKRAKNLTIIGITGSYGKTTTKNALFHILAPDFKVLKTEENYNTLLGIAKNIIAELKPEHQIFICEMGAYQIGDIKAVCNLVKPKIGIVTVIGPMHFERFGSMDNILKAKLELIESLPENGIGFLPKELGSQISKYSHYGNNENKNKIKFFGETEDLYVKIGGIFGISKEEVLSRLKTAPQTPHRREVIKISGDITVIDDTYNSNPAGFAAALEFLKNLDAEKKILVTPGMIELGEKQYELNKNMARNAMAIVDYLIMVGETNKKALADGAKELLKEEFDKKIFWAADLESAKKKLSEIVVPHSAILLENDLPDNYF